MANFPDTPITLVAKLAAQLTCRSDERAWERLFNLYEPAIRKFAELQGAGSNADDIVQEVFLRLVDVLRNGRYSSDGGRFHSYLATLIRHEVISNWRRRQARREGRHLPIDDNEVAAQLVVEDQTADVLDAKWKLARRMAALEHVLTKTAISKQSKDVYRAYVLDYRPVDEVAERFGIPRNSVYQIKVRVEKMVAAVEREISGGDCHISEA